MNTKDPRSTSATGLWLVDKRKYAILPVPLQFEGKKSEILLKMLASGVSRGTERLVFNTQVPLQEYDRMRAPRQYGDFPYPVLYGYCAVAEIIEGPADLIGKKAFCLNPHQDYFSAPLEALTLLPDTMPSERAILAANMETALNGVWDSGATAGDKITIIGGGVVGLLVCALTNSLPGTQVTLIDRQDRSTMADLLGCRFEQVPNQGLDADIVFHCSASESGLQTALECAANEASVIEMSWYGTSPVSLSLGGVFHSKRLRLIGSQVGQIPATHKARWSYQRRMQCALTLLDDPRLDHLLTHKIPFTEAPQALPPLLDDPSALAITLTY